MIGTLDDGDIVQAEDTVTTASRREWRRVVNPQIGFVSDNYLDPVSVGSNTTENS